MNFHEGPIIACSSGGRSNSAIAVIRVSGFSEINQLAKFFTKSGPIEPRLATFTDLINPETKEVLDQVVLTYFKGPNSYNGENILEISVHGNAINIQRIIQLFIEKGGVEHAHPGEFTYRALKNKKLSLSQVEGLDLLLNANSEMALKQGLQTLDGAINKSLLELRENFIKLKSAVELSIDFSEDVGPEESKIEIKKHLNSSLEIVSRLHKRATSTGGISTPKVALVGQTNAGKSTLFNKLLNEERSIVSSIEGTTRDYVTESVFYKGTNYKLIDTAGLRETTDEIEKEGISRVQKVLEESFFKVMIVNPLSFKKENYEYVSEINFDLVVITHSDCEYEKEKFFSVIKDFKIDNFLFTGNGPMGPVVFGPMGAKTKSGPIGAFSEITKSGPIGAKTGESLENHVLDEISNKFNRLSSDDPLLIERQSSIINKIYSEMSNLSRNINDLDDIAVLSSEVDIISNKINDLVGIISPDEVLNSIFSNFCIGK